MAIWEAYESRNRTLTDTLSKGSRAERLYVVEGTDDDDTAMSEAVAAISPTFRGLTLDDIDLERIGPFYWMARARYIDPDKDDSDEKPDVGEIVWGFDTGGAIQHITQTKDGLTTAYAPAGKAAPDFKGAIGVNGDTIDGVDIVVPALRLTATVTLTKTSITDAWVKDVARLTGKVNNAAFYSYAAGELLFMGASGTQRTKGNPTITFNFEASENVGPLSFPNGITVTSKLGHEYLWVYYQPAADGVAKALVQQPVAVYTEQVYELGDFSVLGLGG